MNLQARRAGTPCCSLDDRVDIPRYAREQKSSMPGGWKNGSWYWTVLVLLVAAMVAATAVGISLRIL